LRRQVQDENERCNQNIKEQHGKVVGGVAPWLLFIAISKAVVPSSSASHGPAAANVAAVTNTVIITRYFNRTSLIIGKSRKVRGTGQCRDLLMLLPIAPESGDDNFSE